MALPELQTFQGVQPLDIVPDSMTVSVNDLHPFESAIIDSVAKTAKNRAFGFDARVNLANQWGLDTSDQAAAELQKKLDDQLAMAGKGVNTAAKGLLSPLPEQGDNPWAQKEQDAIMGGPQVPKMGQPQANPWALGLSAIAGLFAPERAAEFANMPLQQGLQAAQQDLQQRMAQYEADKQMQQQLIRFYESRSDDFTRQQGQEMQQEMEKRKMAYETAKDKYGMAQDQITQQGQRQDRQMRLQEQEMVRKDKALGTARDDYVANLKAVQGRNKGELSDHDVEQLKLNRDATAQALGVKPEQIGTLPESGTTIAANLAKAQIEVFKARAKAIPDDMKIKLANSASITDYRKRMASVAESNAQTAKMRGDIAEYAAETVRMEHWRKLADDAESKEQKETLRAISKLKVDLRGAQNAIKNSASPTQAQLDRVNSIKGSIEALKERLPEDPIVTSFMEPYRNAFGGGKPEAGPGFVPASGTLSGPIRSAKGKPKPKSKSKAKPTMRTSSGTPVSF